MRTLIVHSGGTKTGSSALQNFFGAQAGALRNAGVAYEGGPAISSALDITSGNGKPLVTALQERDRASAARIVEEHFAGLDRALCSTEFFEFLDRSGWEALLDVAEARGIEVHVVHFVRHVVPLLVSSYDQQVKRGGEHRPIESWAADCTLETFDTLRSLDALRGRLTPTVLSYDAHRHALVASFLSAIGAPIAEPGRSATPVNRSLSREERDLLRQVNARFASRFSQELSDLLLAADPLRPADQGFDEALVATAERRFGAQVCWTNEAFFGGAPVLSVSGPPPGGAAGPGRERGQGPGQGPEPAALVLSWALGKIETLRRVETSQAVHHLLQARELPRPDDPALPPDFDPLGYLLLNPDLIVGRLNPFVHYLAHGIREGRRFR